MKSLHTCLFSLLLLLYMAGHSAEKPIELHPGQPVSLDNMIYVLEDPSGQLRVDQLHQRAFKKSNTDKLNFEFSSSNFWIRFALISRNKEKETYYISVNNPDLSKVSFYEFRQDTLIAKYTTGKSLDFNTRDVKNRNFVFKVSLLPNVKHTLYICTNSEGDANFTPIAVSHHTTFIEQEGSDLLLNGFFFGFCLLIVLFNIFLSITQKNKMAMYYALYLLVTTLSFLNIYGISTQYLWPSLPLWSKHSTIFLASIGSVFLLYFAELFLSTAKNPIFNALIIIGKITGAILAIFSVLPYPIYLISVIGIGAFIPLVFILISVISINKIMHHDKLAIYFLLAFLSTMTGFVVHVCRDYGLVSHNIFTFNVFRLGMSIEILILTFAIVEHLRHEQKKTKLLLEKQRDELLVARDKAQESDKLKTAFLANMSHEVRTPLNVIHGFSEHLQNNRVSDEEKNEYISHIKNSVSILIRLINDIVDLSKIESRKLEVDISACNVHFMLNELYANYNTRKVQLEKQHIQLVLQIPNHQAEFNILSDPFRLTQILTNLLDNAFKFTSQGEIRFGYQIAENNQIEFFVSDTGSGISKDDCKIIFDRFIKLDNQPTTNKGTGLGLSISKSLVEMLGGKISVESTPGAGSTFRFTIPLYRLPESSANNSPAETTTPTYNWTGKTILVAEDEELNFRFIEILLQRHAAQLLRARNGIEAIELATTREVDLILMDIKMPIMNGLEATTQIKQSKKHIPIIIFTAFAMNHDHDTCSRAGCDAYLTKPLESNKLLHTIERFLL